MGQLVAENIITQPGQTQTVSLGNLPSGLYILMVSDNYSNAKTPFMIE
jgi:hypothetical protein